MGVTIQIRGRVKPPGAMAGVLGQRVVLGAVVLPTVSTAGGASTEAVVSLSADLIKTQAIVASHHAFEE